MIKNAAVLNQFEKEQIKKRKLSYSQSLTIFEAMWKEAVYMGVLPVKDYLVDMEADIRMARILNSENV